MSRKRHEVCDSRVREKREDVNILLTKIRRSFVRFSTLSEHRSSILDRTHRAVRVVFILFTSVFKVPLMNMVVNAEERRVFGKASILVVVKLQFAASHVNNRSIPWAVLVDIALFRTTSCWGPSLQGPDCAVFHELVKGNETNVHEVLLHDVLLRSSLLCQLLHETAPDPCFREFTEGSSHLYSFPSLFSQPLLQIFGRLASVNKRFVGSDFGVDLWGFVWTLLFNSLSNSIKHKNVCLGWFSDHVTFRSNLLDESVVSILGCLLLGFELLISCVSLCSRSGPFRLCRAEGLLEFSVNLTSLLHEFLVQLYRFIDALDLLYLPLSGIFV